MTAYKHLYNTYFAHIRQSYGKRALSDKVVDRRMHKLLDRMNWQDRYYLELYGSYHSMRRVAFIAEVPIKVATKNVNIALNHMITPNTIKEITGVNLFKNKGVALAAYNTFSTRTLNAFRKQGIITDTDLDTWLSLRLVYLYNIPGVGKWSQLEILKYLELTGKLKLNVNN